MKRPITNPLKVARMIKGYSQLEVAREIDRSPAFVSRVENGGPVRIDLATGRKLAEVLGVPERFVFYRNPSVGTGIAPVSGYFRVGIDEEPAE
jgi:transcriptional regulator with XRE-family HTH domain